MSSPKEYHFDAVYPEPLSRLRRGHGHSGGLVASAESSPTAASYRRAVKKQRMNRGPSGRFRTQPVTFQEIKEVDEENVPELEPDLTTPLGKASVATSASRSESDLKARFELFYKSINDPTLGEGGGPVRSPPIAISFPVCPVHSAGQAASPSPLCQATCFPKKTKEETDEPKLSTTGATEGQSGPAAATPTPAPNFIANIAAMGARSRQSF